ncbi:efflux RND transporter periplasmic adaptor subunit [Achromobacter sp. Marseille-Q0513]|uniref:efflux RND transporter periplasmic adaptor subunit n=1 Tax=Achromobacter sp. Marseille-Q0513 TaxID=2829161 RepID=UPI001B8FA179|nr:efflux RND transporter periplasmic adaptor subunit [Achromobacter sp. Marseille-Q0513]MBR8652377.1 efflux RND transporter periplasmic adaptor subunit [Achromobacter sp. Marseille-Q0513]
MTATSPMSVNATSRRKALLARHKYSLAAACAVALAALAALALRAAPAAADEPPPPPPALRVTTIVAGPGAVPIRIAVTGSLIGRDEIAIRTPLQDQRIAAVLVEEGDWVRAGQPLATLETDTLDAQLRQAQAALGRARAQVLQQEALNAEAQAQLRRIAPLAGSGSVSAQQIDQQQAQARASAAALAAARAEQEQARAGLAQAQAQRDKAALLAPADGVVSERHARAGALGGDAPLFKLIRDGLLELDGEVPESALAGILPGMPAQLRVAGTPDAVAGRVRRVSPKVDEATRMGRVRIALDAAQAARAGSFAATTLETGMDPLPVVVPQRAVTFGAQGAASVMVLDAAGRVARRAVTLGRLNGSVAEVRSGLDAGERLVAAAAAFIKEGDVVASAQPEAPAR